MRKRVGEIRLGEWGERKCCVGRESALNNQEGGGEATAQNVKQYTNMQYTVGWENLLGYTYVKIPSFFSPTQCIRKCTRTVYEYCMYRVRTYVRVQYMYLHVGIVILVMIRLNI